MNIKKRIPILFLEFSRLSVENYQLIYSQKEVVTVLNANLYACIILGKGCSITNDATREIAKHRTLLFFSGFHMSSLLMHSCNNYKGKLRQNQYKRTHNKKSRLCLAGKLIKEKNKILPYYLPKIKYKAFDIQSIMLNEAVWTKEAYKKAARHHGQIWLGRQYALQNKSKMFLVNRLLYSLATIAIIGLGLDPNLGIIHNNRSGIGLALDIADLFKPDISYKHMNNSNYQYELVWTEINEKMILQKMIKVLESLFT